MSTQTTQTQQNKPDPVQLARNVFLQALQALATKPDAVQVAAHQLAGSTMVTFVCLVDPMDYDWLKSAEDSVLTGLSQMAAALGARYQQNFSFALHNPAFAGLFAQKSAS